MPRILSLITGGTSGIGFEVSKKFAKRGYDLLLIYLNDSKNAETARNELLAINPSIEVHCEQVHLKNQEGVEKVLALMSGKFAQHRLENFVSCHGRVIPGLFLQVKLESLRTTIEEHLLMNISLTHGLLQRMCVQKYGRIVFLGSMAAHRINRGQSAYSLSKAGLETFVQSLTAEYYQRNVTFNCVSPGIVRTKVTTKIADALEAEGKIKVINPEEIAELISFLCQESSHSITGANFKIEAGQDHVNNNLGANSLSFYIGKEARN